MKSNTIRWVLAVILICSMAFLISSPSLAEIKPLELDQLVPGNPTKAENWVYVKGKHALSDENVLAFGTALPNVLKYASKTRTWSVTDRKAEESGFDWIRYMDESISIRTEYATIIPAYKAQAVPSSITYIEIRDPSQIRTAMSYDKYEKRDYVKAEKMATHVNAVVAVNGDFFKYHYNVGYVVRQGVFYRDSLNGKRDLLLIDNRGDFHAVYAATSDSVQKYLDELPEDLSVINTFTLGPVLVKDGQTQIIKDTSVAKYDEFQWSYPQQRVAILQLDTLKYAVVETYGKTDSSKGLTLQEFADYISFLFPECRVAYNLDGGGSTNVVVNGSRIHKTPGNREISDILYFASAAD